MLERVLPMRPGPELLARTHQALHGGGQCSE